VGNPRAATIKDSFNVAGLHTTWGNPAFKDFVADSDATVAQRLRQAAVRAIEAGLLGAGTRR
jgi:Asp-tRNA(Asn)/Glu-tRNA(Gln) amidotransferase A subunit family amidase